MPVQRCPNCREPNDVSVYVHGQLARCSRCGIRFAVDRESRESNPNAARSPAPGLPSSVATRVPDQHGFVTTVPGGEGASARAGTDPA